MRKVIAWISKALHLSTEPERGSKLAEDTPTILPEFTNATLGVEQRDAQNPEFWETVLDPVDHEFWNHAAGGVLQFFRDNYWESASLVVQFDPVGGLFSVSCEYHNRAKPDTNYMVLTCSDPDTLTEHVDVADGTFSPKGSFIDGKTTLAVIQGFLRTQAPDHSATDWISTQDFEYEFWC